MTTGWASSTSRMSESGKFPSSRPGFRLSQPVSLPGRTRVRIILLLTALALGEVRLSPGLVGLDRRDLRSLLPAPAEFKGWLAESSAQVFEGEDLFIYINGGAEIYFEYGFRRVLVQDYSDGLGRRLSLEIFEMESSEAAYGIFSFKRSASGKAIDLGDETQVADYYLNLWEDSFLVTITGMNDDTKTKEGLLELARLIADKIEGGQPRPALLGLYPEKGLLPQTIKFFRGHLGLFNSYPFFRTDVFAAPRAARADYQTGESVYLFEYANEGACRDGWKRVKAAFQESERYPHSRDEDAFFLAVDRQGKSIRGAVIRNYLIIILNSRERSDAQRLLELIEARIAR